MDNEETFQMETFCDHCQKDTMHDMYCAGHERDSSGDIQTCTECNWWKSGMCDEYNSPIQDSI